MKSRFIQLILNLNKIEINSTYQRKLEYLVLKCRIRAGESNDINNKWRNSQYKLYFILCPSEFKFQTEKNAVFADNP